MAGIIRVANESLIYLKKTTKELSTRGWNSSYTMEAYNSLVEEAKKDQEVIQMLQVLENNVSNPNYHYNAKHSYTSSLSSSRVCIGSLQRPQTPPREYWNPLQPRTPMSSRDAQTII